MNTIRLLVLALLCSSVACAANTVTVHGTVADASGKPVEGARVRAILEYPKVDQASVELTVLSGADGSFSFRKLPLPDRWSPSDLPAREWRCYFVADTADGLFGWAHYWTAFPADHPYKITLHKLGSVRGRVVDESGAGVPGATVVPTDLSLDLSGAALRTVITLKPVTTDADGFYQLDGVPEFVPVSVRPEKEGLAYKGRAQPFGSTVVMIPGGSISGRVVDEHGKPVSGASVQAVASYSQPGDKPGALINRGFIAGSGKAATQADGSYTIRGLGTHRFDVSLVGPPDLVARTISKIDVKAGQTARVPDMVASAGTFISGRVLDADTGKPISNARVSVLGKARPRGIEVQADSSGVYEARVLPGNVTVRYRGGNPQYLPDFGFGKGRLDVPAKGLKGADIRVKRAEVARGRVVDEAGKPVARARVQLQAPGVYQSCSTDEHGAFEIPIPPQEPGKASYDHERHRAGADRRSRRWAEPCIGGESGSESGRPAEGKPDCDSASRSQADRSREERERGSSGPRRCLTDRTRWFRSLQRASHHGRNGPRGAWGFLRR